MSTAPDQKSLTDAWEAIAVAALVGVERQPIHAPVTIDGITALLASREGISPESALLSAAAAISAYRAAGIKPDTVTGKPLPAASEETIRPSSAEAETFLASILTGDYRDVLPEWLNAVRERNRRVSASHLPLLLDAGRQRAALRGPIRAVIGARGHWLAALSDDWSYATLAGSPVGSTAVTLVPTGDADSAHGAPTSAGAAGILTPPTTSDTSATSVSVAETDSDTNATSSDAAADPVAAAWETGARAARVEMLREVRLRDPALARSLIESTWKTDPAGERAAFAAELQHGLSAADEPLLANALADRSVEVGRVALDLLARLPDSQLAARMGARTVSLVKFKKKLLGDWSVDVSLPELTDDLKADRIEEKSPSKLLGDHSWLLCQIIGATPLSWRAHHGAPSPEHAVEAAGKSEWAVAVICGLGIASRRYADPAWIEAIAQYWAERDDRAAVPKEFKPDPAADPALAERIVLNLMHRHSEPLHDTHPACEWIEGLHAPWSLKLATAVSASMRKRVESPQANVHAWGLLNVMPQIGIWAPAAQAQAVIAIWTEPEIPKQSYWTNAIEKMVRTLEFRKEMIAALDKETTR